MGRIKYLIRWLALTAPDFEIRVAERILLELSIFIEVGLVLKWGPSKALALNFSGLDCEFNVVT